MRPCSTGRNGQPFVGLAVAEANQSAPTTMNIQDIIKRLTKEDIAKLNEIHEDFANAEEFGDCEYYPEHVYDIIADAVDRFVDDWFDAIGTTFRDTYNGNTIEVILVECDNGWVPSVRSDHWDAPDSTIDPELARADPKQALSWGIQEALIQHLIQEGVQ